MWRGEVHTWFLLEKPEEKGPFGRSRRRRRRIFKKWDGRNGLDRSGSG
jgi:hypothetical protein